MFLTQSQWARVEQDQVTKQVPVVLGQILYLVQIRLLAEVEADHRKLKQVLLVGLAVAHQLLMLAALAIRQAHRHHKATTVVLEAQTVAVFTAVVVVVPGALAAHQLLVRAQQIQSQALL